MSPLALKVDIVVSHESVASPAWRDWREMRGTQWSRRVSDERCVRLGRARARADALRARTRRGRRAVASENRAHLGPTSATRWQSTAGPELQAGCEAEMWGIGTPMPVFDGARLGVRGPRASFHSKTCVVQGICRSVALRSVADRRHSLWPGFGRLASHVQREVHSLRTMWSKAGGAKSQEAAQNITNLKKHVAFRAFVDCRTVLLTRLPYFTHDTFHADEVSSWV